MTEILGRRCKGSGRRRGAKRKAYSDHRFARSRLDRDLSAVAVDDDAPRDIEAQARALSYVLGVARMIL